MSPDETQAGLSCFYPPRIASAVDVTEQTENGSTRYIIRNRSTARYFILKRPEYQVFQRIDGTRRLDQIAGSDPDSDKNDSGPRASRQAAVNFLAKLDSLGLIDRLGELTGERSDRGHYLRFRLFNPDNLLGWIDRKAGWLLARPF